MQGAGLGGLGFAEDVYRLADDVGDACRHDDVAEGPKRDPRPIADPYASRSLQHIVDRDRLERTESETQTLLDLTDRERMEANR